MEMSQDTLLLFLGWSTVLHYGLLALWFIMFMLARSFIYKLHSRWFPMSENQFNVIHYSGILLYKLFVFVFFLGPYVVLRCLLGL